MLNVQKNANMQKGRWWTIQLLTLAVPFPPEQNTTIIF